MNVLATNNLALLQSKLVPTNLFYKQKLYSETKTKILDRG